ncbi:MAG: hypothetical protein E2O88_08945 [Bacteroidetes bacterium]|nr:MAG: hypothetical protein E2O88_08945 [Bacteroidota bacterium]
MIRIPLKKYFPFQINLVSILLIVAGVLIGPESIWLSLILLIIGLTIFTAGYKISIDPMRQTFREYLFFAGFKIGKAKKYNRLENIIISSHQFNQRVNSRTSTRTFQTVMYKGFVQFSDHDKILIAESQIKKK